MHATMLHRMNNEYTLEASLKTNRNKLYYRMKLNSGQEVEYTIIKEMKFIYFIYLMSATSKSASANETMDTNIKFHKIAQ